VREEKGSDERPGSLGNLSGATVDGDRTGDKERERERERERENSLLSLSGD